MVGLGTRHLQILFNVPVNQAPQFVLWPGPPNKGAADNDDPEPSARDSFVDLPRNAIPDF